MELQHYLAIVRRRWLIAAGLPLLALIFSLAVALTRPPMYGLTLRVLTTRSDRPHTPDVALSPSGDDTTAMDLPAVITGGPFLRDLADELSRQGHPADPGVLVRGLRGWNQGHVVSIAVTAASPDEVTLIAQTILQLVERNGLRYWGASAEEAPPDRPGVRLSVLEMPPPARLNGLRTIVLEVGLRTLVGLSLGVGLAFLLHYLEWRAPECPQPAHVGQAERR